MKMVIMTILSGVMALASGCIRVRSDPVEVEIKPIHVTVDVNLRVQRELDDVFGGIDSQDPTLKQGAK